MNKWDHFGEHALGINQRPLPTSPPKAPAKEETMPHEQIEDTYHPHDDQSE